MGCQSPALFASEPPSPSEPELSCNNLYVGPLIPHAYNKLNTQPIYDNLRAPKENDIKDRGTTPKAIIIADQNNPVRRIEPKIIIKPTMTRTLSDPHKNKSIPRVCVNDNLSPIVTIRHNDNNIINKNEPDIVIKAERCVETNDDNTQVDNSTTKDVVVEQQQQQQEIKEIPKEIVDIGEKSNKTSATLKNSNTSLNKGFSTSSESSPSEESDTGTVVKRV